MKYILVFIFFLTQSYLIAQESQSRSGEVNNSYFIPDIDTTSILQSPKVVVLKEQAFNNQNTIKTLEHKPHQVSKRFIKQIQTLKNRKFNPEKKEKKHEYDDLTMGLGVFFLILAFFFLVRFPITKIWLFFIGLVLTIIGAIWIHVEQEKTSSEFGKALVAFFLGVPTLLFGVLPLMFGLFGYLAYLWNAFILFNIIGLICLGLSLIFFSLHLFLS